MQNGLSSLQKEHLKKILYMYSPLFLQTTYFVFLLKNYTRVKLLKIDQDAPLEGILSQMYLFGVWDG